ncbi:MAG: ATP-binding protein [Lachnoclostridium sp.]|nr:ATP-binding protein [Lachnospira sp.]MCM1247933.1 ATP-binding protein [Lachnoclostridium sp.]MCM1536215.1 ATP-binding protein [Clostridium sp.]
MTKKIFKSIMIVAGAVLIASLVIIMGGLYRYFSNLQEKQLEDELSLAVIAVEKNGQEYLEKLPSSGYRLTWVAENGDVIYDTQSDKENMENHGDREEIQQALQSREGKSSRYSTTLLEKTLYCARRLNDGSVLRISASSISVWMLVFGMTQPICIVIATALVLSGVLADRISKHIMEPLNSLDLEKPLENDTYEELAPLLSRLHRQHRQIDMQLAQLQRQNDEFTQITQGMAEGLVLLNDKSLIVSINPAALELFHAQPSCIGKDFLTIERSPGISHAVQDAFLNGHSEIRTEQNGKEYQFHINRIESRGAVIGAVLLAFDISEIAFTERNRREFTANVSHELKTPLQSIMGSAELIENGLVKPEDMTQFVGHIRTEAERLVTLIDDIIRLSKLDEGCDMPFEDVDLYEIATDTAAELNEIAAAKNVEITVTGGTVKIKSVRRLLTEILFNLCDNAVKYNTQGGTVIVSITEQEKLVVISVKDSGIGIPPEHQARIFERFYRVDKSRSKESGGTGLGLSIVKHAVQYLNGRIDLKSSPGEGTLIQISFPISQETP